MNITQKMIHAGVLTAAVGSLFGARCMAGDQTSLLKPGPIPSNTVHLDNARNYPYCEFEVITGRPPDLTVEGLQHHRRHRNERSRQ